jgi:hypothetical protein
MLCVMLVTNTLSYHLIKASSIMDLLINLLAQTDAESLDLLCIGIPVLLVFALVNYFHFYMMKEIMYTLKEVEKHLRQ